jgi:hypothetical protein
VTQLNGTGDKGHGTREGLSYRQIVRSANRQVGRRQRMANSNGELLEWLSATTEKAVNGE